MYSETVEKNGPWSFSMVKECDPVQGGCPKQSKFKRVDKLRPLPSDNDSLLKVGSAIHSVLELKLKTRDLPSPMSTSDAVSSACLANDLTKKEMPEVKKVAVNVELFMERVNLWDRKFGVKAIHVEHKFGLDKDLRPTGFFDKDVFFRGVVDLAVETEKKMIIIDHKSGRPFGGLKAYQAQLDIYNIYGRACFPHVPYFQSAVNFISYDEFISSGLRSREQVDNEVVPWFKQWLNKSTQDFGMDKANPGRPCSWCGFRDRCPESYHGK